MQSLRRRPHCSLERIEVHRVEEYPAHQATKRAISFSVSTASALAKTCGGAGVFFFTPSQLQTLIAKHLIDFGEASDQIHKTPVLVHLAARVVQRKLWNAARARLAADFSC